MLRRATPGHPMKRPRMADMPGLMRWIERFVLAVGFVLLTIWLAAYVHRVLMVRVAMKNFEDARRQAAGNMPPTGEPRTVTKEESPAVMGDSKKPTADYAGAGSTAVNSRGEIPLAMRRGPLGDVLATARRHGRILHRRCAEVSLLGLRPHPQRQEDMRRHVLRMR